MHTRYPLVLVHGLAMKETFFMRSFGRIDRILRIQGHRVYVSHIDSFGSIESNAGQLKAEILAILLETGADKVNIIAHSKGGLDAKYMITDLGMAEHIASLTTLCTPHRGSPVASFVLRFPLFMLQYAAFFINLAYRILGDKHPDALTACRQLQRVPSIHEETLLTDHGVFCQSFSASINRKDKHTDFIMGIPAMFCRLIDRGAVTDGLVPQDSAIFGEYRGECINGSVSHTEIVDFMVRDQYRDRIYAFYSALCEELCQMGY